MPLWNGKANLCGNSSLGSTWLQFSSSLCRFEAVTSSNNMAAGCIRIWLGWFGTRADKCANSNSSQSCNAASRKAAARSTRTFHSAASMPGLSARAVLVAACTMSLPDTRGQRRIAFRQIMSAAPGIVHRRRRNGGPRPRMAKKPSGNFRPVIKQRTMTEAAVLNRRSLRAPARVDESKLSQPLRDLFATWRVSLREEFKGLTASGEVVKDLFPPRAAGASTQPMLAAVNEFIASLDAGQRAAVSFPVRSEAWRHWSNIHRNVMRHGLCFAELSERQRELAYAIMRAGLGARAYDTARNAMRLNEHLAELTGLPDEFGEFFYWISIFGTPS